jgi:hypothetical protein
MHIYSLQIKWGLKIYKLLVTMEILRKEYFLKLKKFQYKKI